MKPRIGFIGLGEMGKGMAINVAKVGFPLTVYDIRPEPISELASHDAMPGGNPAELASLALAQGLGNENKGAMIKVWERVLGVEVRKK